MKILQVITSMNIGGAEKLVSQIAPMLNNKDIKCDVALFNGRDTKFKQDLLDAGINVFDLSYNNHYYNIGKIFKLWRLLRNYDVAHIHNTAPQLFAAIAKMLCSVVLCTTEHNTSNRRRNLKWFRLIDQWMYNRYKKVICISNQAELNLREYLGSSFDNITTIFNGVDINLFHNAPIATEYISKDKFVVTMVAGFRYQKDQDTIIRAMSLLDTSKFELRLVGDGERRNELESLIKELSLQNCVKLLGIRADVPNILKASDVVVMSSHFEGLSLSNIEGMSVGKPFIASDVDGLREVTSGYGILFPHEDAHALANEIKRLSEDKNYYCSTADKCWERAQMFDINKMVDGYEKVYRQIYK